MKKLKWYKQVCDVSAALYANRLYTKALLCEIVCEKKHFQSLSVADLEKSLCNSMRMYLRQHLHAPLMGLAKYVGTVVKNSDRKVRLSGNLSNYKITRVSSMPYKFPSNTVIGDEMNGNIKTS